MAAKKEPKFNFSLLKEAAEKVKNPDTTPEDRIYYTRVHNTQAKLYHEFYANLSQALWVKKETDKIKKQSPEEQIQYLKSRRQTYRPILDEYGFDDESDNESDQEME